MPPSSAAAPQSARPLRVGWNLLHVRPEIGGGWSYISNLLAAVGRQDHTNEYVAFVTADSESIAPRQPNVRIVRTHLDSSFRLGRVAYENTWLQFLVHREQIDCLHWFANVHGLVNAAPALVTVYDLQPFVGFRPLPLYKRFALQWQLRRAVRHAAQLLPISGSTAADMTSRLGADRSRMVVMPPMLEADFQPSGAAAIEAIRQRYGLPPQFWLYVAHVHAHKNHERLLVAYRELKRQLPETWPLVLRSSLTRDWPIPPLLAQLGLTRDVIVLPELERTALPALYSAATAMVFPSLYEGAGIPVIEALACGCPVLASDIAPLREFAGDAAAYMDPCDPVDMYRAMRRIAQDPEARERLRQLGRARSLALRAIPVVDNLLRAYAQAVVAS
jgi:glycosyltransferase involved in cell wall biosynthesis